MGIRVWIAVLLSAAWAGGAVGGERATAMPTGPLRAYFEGERSAGAERSEPLARALLWTAKQRPDAERDRLLLLAAQADPALVDPHLVRAGSAMRGLDLAGAVAALGDAWDAVRRDAREEARTMRALVHAAHWLLTATLFTLAVLIALRNLRLTRHAVGEALGARVAALVLLVVPVVAAAVVSPALAVLVVLAGSTPFLRRRESRTLGAVCLMLALVDGGMRLFAPHALLLDARTRTAKIAHLNDAGHDGALERQLAAEARRPAEVELVLGLQARRRGDSATAQQRFVAALRADSTCAAAYVNLANLFFREGSYERAATGYRAAQALEPELPLSYANLAQTYIRMTKYAESDHELRAASDRGIADISQRRGLWRDEAQPVFDATLQRETLLTLAAAELDAVPSLRHTVLQTWRSRPWRHFPPVVAIVLLAVTGGILLWTPRLSRIAVCCPECGIVMCTHCVAMSPLDDRCNPCQIARPRPRAPGAEMISTDRRRRLSLATGRWVAPLFPGSADLVRGAPVAATFAIAAAWIMLGVAALGIEIARLRSEAWYVATDARLLQAAATVVGILWLPGLFKLRARERNAAIVVRRAPQTGA